MKILAINDFIKNNAIVCFDRNKITLAFNVETLSNDLTSAINEINFVLNSDKLERVNSHAVSLSHRLNRFVCVSYSQVNDYLFNVAYTFDKQALKRDDRKLYKSNKQIIDNNYADLIILASQLARNEMNNI